MYKYHCVACGQEVKEDEMLVPLAYMALDGATAGVMLRNHLYITKQRLAELIERVDKNTGCQYVTMQELIEIAYSKLNRRDLVNAAPSAQEAYQTYKETYDDAMKELLEARKEKEEKLAELGEEDDEDDDDLALEDAWEKVEIPGFNQSQVRQLCENFPDGVCSCYMNMAKGYGLEFKLDRPGTFKRNTPSFLCPHCLMEVCDCAFEKKQIMIGFVGFQDVGKSCLIMALSNYLLEIGATLKIPSPDKEKLFTKQYRNYRAGLTLMKTQAEQGSQTLYSPSVLIDDILWTFVDVPGDTIFDETQSTSFDPVKLSKDPRFQAILHCDTYILCTRSVDIEDPLTRTKTMDVFSRFLQYASDARNEMASFAAGKQTEILFPVILTLAQLDENTAARNLSQKDLILYNMDQYRYKREYSVMMANGMGNIIDNLKTLCYFTPISTSAYGFEPTRYEKWEQWDEKHEKLTGSYRKPEPRNLQELFQWVQMINGIKPSLKQEEAADKKIYLAETSRSHAHVNDNTVTVISQLFCNPSEIDTKWYNTIGGGVFNSVKRNQIKSEAKSKGMKIIE